MNKKTDENEFKINRNIFLSKLKDIIDINLIDISKDDWIIDSVNDLYISFYGNELIVGFHTEHKHFGEIYGHENNTFIDEALLLIKDLLGGQTRFEFTYRGKREIHLAYYIKQKSSDYWKKYESYNTSLFGFLIPFPHKTIKEIIIEFKQQ